MLLKNEKKEEKKMPKKRKTLIESPIPSTTNFILSKLTVSCRVISDTDRSASFHMYPPAVVVVVWNVERAEIDARTKRNVKNLCPHRCTQTSRRDSRQMNVVTSKVSVCQSDFVHNHPPLTQFY